MQGGPARVEARFASHDGSAAAKRRVLAEPPMALFPGERGTPPPLDVLLARMSEALDMDLVLLGHVNETHYTTVAFHERAPLGFTKGTCLPIGETYCREEIIAERPFVLGDAELEERFRDHPGYRKHGLRSYVGVPLFLRDGTLFGTVCGVDGRARRIPLAAVEETLRLAEAISDALSDRMGLRAEHPWRTRSLA